MGDIGELNEILTIENCQIIPLSYTSQFGFVFKIIYQDKTEILKTYILADLTNLQNEEVGKKKQKKMSIDDNRFKLSNYIDVASMGKARGLWAEEEPGYGKRAESRENFIKEATIQNEVYNTSINNGPLCPEIYGSYIVDYINANTLLELLKTKCRGQLEQLEGENMIEYLRMNLNRYQLGMIRMEYAGGYTTFRKATKNPTLYENVIYANIRLLMETGYLHLDLNPGNVMVRDNEVLLIDFGKTKDIIEIIQTFGIKNVKDFERIREIIIKQTLESIDIDTIIDFIIKCEVDYLVDLDELNRGNKGLFYINFVSKLTIPERSYQNIAKKLNEITNKTVSPKYKTLQIQSQNTVVSSNSSPINHVFGLFGSDSPPSIKRGSSLFGDESLDLSHDSEKMPPNIFLGRSSPQSNKRGSSLFGDESLDLSHDSENINPNDNNMYLSTPPTTPRGGAKKSKKTKRKPIHNKRRSKTRKNKSNKKRVKLISNK